MKMHITDVGRRSYRPASRARFCKVTFWSHHTAQHGMRSTATHVAWSVYLSVCCTVTSVSPAKKPVNRSKCMSFGYGFVYPRNRHGIRWGRDLSCTRKGSFVETVILGHTQTCLRSIVSTLFTTRQQRCGLCYDFHNNLLVLLF